MEFREGNVIVNVDQVLPADKTRFIGELARIIKHLVENDNETVWLVAADGILRTAMAVNYALRMTNE